MHFSTLCITQAILLLPYFFSLPSIVSTSDVHRRTGSCDDDNSDDEAPTSDGPTTDQSPGIGVEFETGQLRFQSLTTTKQNSDSLKGNLVDSRKGINWKLTPDSFGVVTQLNGEYILDGTTILLGSGEAEKAANEVVADILDWSPSAGLPIKIAGSNVDDWKIFLPIKGDEVSDMFWAPQVTAPMPLEAINDLFLASISDRPSALLPSVGRRNGMTYVTSDFFQAKPNGMLSAGVSDALLGFLSLVVSYAKSATAEADDQSPKFLTSIMPRTDFTTMYNLVKSEVKGSLFDLVRLLACYQNDGSSVRIDPNYCGGTVDTPEPNDQMNQQEFSVEGIPDTCTVQDWLKSIDNNEAPDCLTVFDRGIDGSIGGLSNRLEYVLHTTRAVPLFEFRRLPKVVTGNMAGTVKDAEQEIVEYHAKYSKASRFVRRRLNARYPFAKRQNGSDACFPASSGTATAVYSTGSATFSSDILTTASSTSSTSSTSSISTLPLVSATSSTLVTSATLITSATPTPSLQVFLSNNSVTLGDENSKNNGVDLRNAMYSKLQTLCPDTADACSSTKGGAEINNIASLSPADQPDQGSLNFTISDSNYNSPKERDQMLVAAVASWQQAAAKTCKSVPYRGDPWPAPENA